MKTWILVQSILTKQEVIGTNVQNYWDTIIRKVEAEEKETAIGKFVVQTNDIKAKEKLDIQCIDFSQLKELKS